MKKSAYERYMHKWHQGRCRSCGEWLRKDNANVLDLCERRAPKTDYGLHKFIKQITKRDRRKVAIIPRQVRPMPHLAQSLAEAETLKRADLLKPT